MNVEQLLKRARKFSDGPCTYRLGKGGRDGKAAQPMDAAGGLDCSGFVSWCLGINRKTDNPLYKKLNGGWIETSAVWKDASIYTTGLFRQIKEAKPGCIVVYPDSGGRQGHIGIVSLVVGGAASTVIHCSSSNKKGAAIQITTPNVFLKNSKTIYAWYDGVDE